MRKTLYIVLLLLLSLSAVAQQTTPPREVVDTMYIHEDESDHTHSVTIVSDEPADTTRQAHADLRDEGYTHYINLRKQPNAIRSVWLGAIVPGLGQIYNGSYWKLPIVYGGLMGCGYAISLNQNKYSGYKNAYIDLYNDQQHNTVSEDPSKSYMAIMPEGYTIDRMGGVSAYMTSLKNWQSTYRRYRDLSIVATVLVYALSLVDAYVDAQLFDFDISPDLSLHIEPNIYMNEQQQRQQELKLAITF